MKISDRILLLYLGADGFDQLVHIAKCKKLRKGELLFEKGQISSFYYLVETGFLCNNYYKEGVITHTNFNLKAHLRVTWKV